MIVSPRGIVLRFTGLIVPVSNSRIFSSRSASFQYLECVPFSSLCRFSFFPSGCWLSGRPSYGSDARIAAEKAFRPHLAYPFWSIISWHRVWSYVYCAIGSPACGSGINSKCGVFDPGPFALLGITTLVIWNFSPVCTSVHLHPIRSIYFAFWLSLRSAGSSVRNCDSFGRLLNAFSRFFRCLRCCRGLFSPR